MLTPNQWRIKQAVRWASDEVSVGRARIVLTQDVPVCKNLCLPNGLELDADLLKGSVPEQSFRYRVTDPATGELVCLMENEATVKFEYQAREE